MDARALATALFARTDVLGFGQMEYELTPDAIELGLDDALPAVFEIGEFGRGERTRPDGTYLIVGVRTPVRRMPTRSGPRVPRALVGHWPRPGPRLSASSE